MNLKEILARAEAATKGPWTLGEKSDDFYYPGWDVRNTHDVGLADCIQARADADFIAHARSDIPALCEEVERLRGLLRSFVECFDVADPQRFEKAVSEARAALPPKEEA